MSLNRKEFANISKYPQGGSFKKETEEEKKARKLKDKNTIEWLKANPEPNWPKNFKRWHPRTGNNTVPKYKKDVFKVPGVGNFRMTDVDKQGNLLYPIIETNNSDMHELRYINGKRVVLNDLFNQEYAQPYQRFKNRGDIIFKYGIDKVEEDGEIKNLTDKEIKAYRDGGYVVEEYHEGGTVHNKSPHPHEKKSVNHVSFDSETIGKKLDNNIAEGTIPMYVDQQGESRVHPRQGVYTQGRKKGRDLPGVYKQPVNFRQIIEDQQDGVKNLFMSPKTAQHTVDKTYEKKLHKLPIEKRRTLIRRMNSIGELYNQQNNIGVGDDGLSREKLYELATTNKELIAAAKDYDNEKDKMYGTVNQIEDKEELTTMDKIIDVAVNPLDAFQTTINGQPLSDAWADGTTMSGRRELAKQTGTEYTINGNEASMVGDALNQYNPARFISENAENIKEGRWGSLAVDALLTAAPAIIGKSGKIVKKAFKNEYLDTFKGLKKMAGAVRNADKVTRAKRVLDFGEGALTSTYHAGKMAAFPGIARTVYDKGKLAQDDKFVARDALDIGTDVINVYNPLKKLTGTGNLANYLVRESKDLFKAGSAITKGIQDNDSKQFTKAALYAASTALPTKSASQVGVKLGNKYVSPWINETFLPTVKKALIPGGLNTNEQSEEETLNNTGRKIVDSKIHHTPINVSDSQRIFEEKGSYPTKLYSYKFARGGEIQELSDKKIKELRAKGAIVIEQ